MLMRRLCVCAKREAGSCRRSGAWNSTRKGGERRLGGCKACGPGVGSYSLGHHTTCLPPLPPSSAPDTRPLTDLPTCQALSCPRAFAGENYCLSSCPQGSFLSLCLLPTGISHFI